MKKFLMTRVFLIALFLPPLSPSIARGETAETLFSPPPFQVRADLDPRLPVFPSPTTLFLGEDPSKKKPFSLYEEETQQGRDEGGGFGVTPFGHGIRIYIGRQEQTADPRHGLLAPPAAEGGDGLGALQNVWKRESIQDRLRGLGDVFKPRLTLGVPF